MLYQKLGIDKETLVREIIWEFTKL
jgi:hypothetical protein